MKKGTCEGLLLLYLGLNPGWHKKVHLYAVAEDYSPETVGRALRQLQEENKIDVDYYEGKINKHLAMYAIKNTQRISKDKYIITGRDEKGNAILTKNPNYA